jgi:hypothetical protein
MLFFEQKFLLFFVSNSRLNVFNYIYLAKNDSIQINKSQKLCTEFFFSFLLHLKKARAY